MASKGTATLAIAFAVVAISAPDSLAQPGDLDPSFGGDGKVTTALSRRLNNAQDVAFQPDGKLVVVGSAGQRFGLARYNPDGTLDTSFGGDGKVRSSFERGQETAKAVVIQPDGKIVVGGWRLRRDRYVRGALVRYNTDGTLDASFGGDGAIFPRGGSIHDVALQSDGKVITVGSRFRVSRYNADGTLDLTFVDDGRVQIRDFGRRKYRGTASAVSIEPDGRIVVAGEAGTSDPRRFEIAFAVARLKPDGSLDASFSDNGKVFTPWSGYDVAHAMVIQPDDKIVVAGAWEDFDRFALIRYNEDGTLDTSFGGDGKVTTETSRRGYDDYANAVALQSDGKIVAAGQTRGTRSFGLVRYNPDGSRDDGFGDDGIIMTTFGRADATAFGMAIQPDDKTVAVGVRQRRIARFAVARYLPT